jgi:hypothetical protein
MVVTFDLKAEVQARLSAEAARRQMTLDQLITEFAEDLPLDPLAEAPKRLSFIGIGDSGRGDLGRRHQEIRKECQVNRSQPLPGLRKTTSPENARSFRIPLS